MYVYIYMHIHIYTYTHTYMCMYLYLYIMIPRNSAIWKYKAGKGSLLYPLPVPLTFDTYCVLI